MCVISNLQISLKLLLFLTRVAMLCEAHDHHAEITNIYNRVTLRLTTHDNGGISQRDEKLGNAINLLI
jgi:Pterin-4a-carbinolamine dehydratase